MTSSNNKVVTVVRKCGHKRSYHRMAGPYYFFSTDENTTMMTIVKSHLTHVNAKNS